jgi:hypothetical protein
MMIVWKNAEEAAIKWKQPEIKDEYLRRWIDGAERLMEDKNLSDSYKVGYLIATLKAIKAHLINIQQ